MHPEILDAANTCGFRPQILPPKLPFAEQYENNKDQMYRACIGAHGGESLLPLNMSGLSHLSLAELSLICSHRYAMDIISRDPSMADSDWALIMEDDATLNPKVDRSRALLYAKEAINYARQYSPVEGFIYFGICHGICRNRFASFALDRKFTVGSKCFGHCTHAYAITKFTAGKLFKRMYTNKFLFNNTFVQIDQAMNDYFSPVGAENRSVHALVAGFNFPGPDEKKHVGLMYQWKRTKTVRKDGTSLRSNVFQPQTCFIMPGDGGSISELLQQYALLISFCVAKNATVHPLQCASFVSPQSNNPIFDIFKERFNIRNVECAPNGVIATDSDMLNSLPRNHFLYFNVDKKNSARDMISRVKYGSTLVGKFNDIPMYSGGRPWLRQVLESASPYDQSLVSNDQRASTSAWSWLPDWLAMRSKSLTVDSVSCPSTATRVCVHVSTEGFGKNISLARRFYVAAFHHLSRIHPEGVMLKLFIDDTVFDSYIHDVLSFKTERYSVPVCVLSRMRYSGVLSAGDYGVSREAEHDVWMIQQLQGCSRIVVAKSKIGWWAAYLSSAAVFITSTAEHIEPTWTAIDFQPVKNKKSKRKSKPS